jgi:hypothetical protein
VSIIAILKATLDPAQRDRARTLQAFRITSLVGATSRMVLPPSQGEHIHKRTFARPQSAAAAASPFVSAVRVERPRLNRLSLWLRDGKKLGVIPSA